MPDPALPAGMTARPESEFPTIRDLRDALSELVADGFGDLPVQIVIVPDSTLQAIGRMPDGGPPAVMIDLVVDGSPRIPPSMVSMRSVGGRGMLSVRRQ